MGVETSHTESVDRRTPEAGTAGTGVGADRRWQRSTPRDLQVIAHETEAVQALRHGDFSRWARPGGYEAREELTGHPERLFLFSLGGLWYAGWKTISDYVVERDMPGLFCSRVYWHNVLGLVEGLRTCAVDARVTFRPLDEAARRAVFAALTPDTELIHPFVKQREPGREKTGPADGWLVTGERAAFLGMGEEHIRSYTRDRFGGQFAALTEDVVAYDPACSTGQFLSDFATLNPARIRTVGQDLSKQMVEYAESRLERVYHGDAMRPAVPLGSVDILFSRFLNSEVVTTEQARSILPGLVAALRPGATLVLFGHSPLLLDAHDLVNAGLRVRQSLARQDDYVFQYYICTQGA